MLLLDPQSDGTTKYPLSVCFSVRHFFACPWFVSLELLSRTAFFFIKQGYRLTQKVTKSNFFEKKNKLTNSFIILRDQSRFKRFYKFYEKLTCEIFMIFYMKLQQQVLKLIKLFSWGKSNSEFSTKNGFKMGTKMKFFKFYEKLVHIISLMFYMNL